MEATVTLPLWQYEKEKKESKATKEKLKALIDALNKKDAISMTLISTHSYVGGMTRDSWKVIVKDEFTKVIATTIENLTTQIGQTIKQRDEAILQLAQMKKEKEKKIKWF